MRVVDSRGQIDSNSDIELMSRLRSGDLQALGSLFLRHHARVYELCFRLCGDSQTADDLVQEIFLRVLRYRNNFAGKAAFPTWLNRIARNVCLDHFAKTKRRRSAQYQALESLSEETESSIDFPDERLTFLNKALMALPLEKREVLILSRYHSLSYAEIGKVCNCSESAVKVRVHRALRQLRDLYFELDRENDEV